jgi:hypothetical protein
MLAARAYRAPGGSSEELEEDDETKDTHGEPFKRSSLGDRDGVTEHSEAIGIFSVCILVRRVAIYSNDNGD